MKTGAVILAAGASEEMKALRPMLYLGGKPMIKHMTDALATAGAEPIVVVTGCRGRAVRRLLADSGVEFAENRGYERNTMFESILLGLSALRGRCGRVLMVPADMPLIKVDTLKALMTCDAPAARPAYNGTPGHPVALSAGAADRLTSYKGGGGLRAALKELELPITDVPVDDEGILLDVNTREEYARAQELDRSRKDTGALSLRFDLQLTAGDALIDNELMELLEMVEFTGSLQTASECVNSSYAKSWRKINRLERELGVSLLQSAAGGVGGGGSRLTEEGNTLLAAYSQMRTEGRRMMGWLFREHFPDDLVQKIQKRC